MKSSTRLGHVDVRHALIYGALYYTSTILFFKHTFSEKYDSRPRPPECVVGGDADDVAVVERRGDDSRLNQPRHLASVCHQVGSHLVRDLAEPPVVKAARV